MDTDARRIAVAVRDLSLALPAGGDRANAVDGVSFDLVAGEILCLVGESGSGKSMCAHALMGLLPKAVRPVSGTIRLGDTDLLGQDDAAWRDTSGRRIAMIFQEPMTSLNPVLTVGFQIGEALRLHRGLSRGAAEAEIDTAGEQRLQGVKALRHGERRMVRQHDAARANPHVLRDRCDLADHDVGRGTRDVRHVVVLGDPVAGEAEVVGVAREVDAVAQRLRAGVAGGDGREVENGQWTHGAPDWHHS